MDQEAERDDRLHEPEFSVIIPVYNVAAYLRECLDSIRAQTFTDWEAICVDDGSTDESGAILDEYAATDNRFTIIHQENRGVNFARQKALEAAKGVWIASVDGDDWIDKDYFKEVHRALDGSGCEFAWCDYYTVKNGTVTRRHQPYSTEPEKLQVGLLDESIWGGNWDKFYARKFLVANNVSFYCEDRVLICEDALFNCKVFSFRPIAKYIPFSGYYYRIRSGSLTHSPITISRLRSWTIVTNEFLKYALTDEVVACVRYPQKIIKAYVYSAPSIPNNVFYNLYPDIRSLKGHTIALRHKILFWLAVRGLRTPVLWFCALSRKILKKDSH